MGHWSQDLIEETMSGLSRSTDRELVGEVLLAVGKELDVLSGRSFSGVHTATSTFEPNGLPIVDVPDVHVGSLSGPSTVWAIPDPVRPGMASVLQLQGLEPSRTALPIAEALWVAGQLVTHISKEGRLTPGYVLSWLRANVPREQHGELFRRVMDPNVRFLVPVFSASLDGWWIQITRRLVWFTHDLPDEGRLLEPLLGDPTIDPEVPPLAAVEPILTVARMTHQPMDWAMTARIWTDEVRRPTDRRWTIIAGAVHGHGVPTLVIDPESSAAEVACQLVLKAFWHGYIAGNDPALVAAVQTAYAGPVERIRRGTRSLTSVAAAAALLEELVFPGFDPARGAELTRRYVRRKASIVVMEHKKRESPEQYPWTRVGVTERHFYKLLPKFAQKVSGRYEYDHDEVVLLMRAHLIELERQREIRSAALAVLEGRGFSNAAARKWLQRHEPEEALRAVPRRTKSHTAATPAQ